MYKVKQTGAVEFYFHIFFCRFWKIMKVSLYDAVEGFHSYIVLAQMAKLSVYRWKEKGN